MHIVHKTLLASAILAGITASGQAVAELEGNIGLASNYIWRGVTQTDDQAAISGGLDYSASGFYVGTWASNVDFGDGGYELDGYLGYGGEVGDFGYDVGYIYYAYPSLEDSDFSEVYVNGSYSMFSLGVAYMVDSDATDQNYIYINGAVDLEISEEYGLSLYAGQYDWDGDDVGNGDDSYVHYGASLSKGDFAFAVDKNDIDDGGNTDDPRVTVSWSQTF